MNWYIAKIIFNIQLNNGINHSQFDEQLRLIEAAGPADAFSKARLLGKEEENRFKNENGEDVTWKFIDVADIQQLNELQHGTEVYSFTHEDRESDDYINFIRRKAQILQIRDYAFA